jgi:arylsulfatase A-like enzyme/lysophospholipase L1-like esterase
MKSTRLLPILILTLIPWLAAAADRPNILWLVSEDNNPLLGCHGEPLARTPALDKLAAEGVLFDRCFAQPVCAPSRFTLITGTFAVSSGPANHMRAQGGIPHWIKGFPELLRAAGYYTANNAKTDYNSPIDLKKTWNESGKKAHYRNRPDSNQPFFSVFNHEVTHESHLFPKEDVALGFTATDPARVRIPAYQPDTPEIRADWARFHDHIALMDGQIAKKLKALEQDGLAADTIVFYFGDNGGVLPRSKRFLQQSGTHVPLIMYFPPKWRHLAPAAPGTRLSDPVSFVDFAPTVLSLAGVEIPAHMPGRPFAGPKAAKNEFVFCTRDRMDERHDMMRSVMDSRWLCIRNFRPDLSYVQPLEYMFKARGYQSWARLAGEGKLTPATSQFWGIKPREELYDMAADPDNVRNLATDPAQRKTLARMRAALKQHTLDIIDNGFLPEGSELEGYEASRKPGAWPVERVFDMACLASERKPANLPQFIAALDDPSEPIRWWAAQGCTMLRRNAATAEAALRKRLDDPSGAVQIAAAEALAQSGKPDIALPVLERWIQNKDQPQFALQAANVLDRMGKAALPALPAMKKTLPSAHGTPMGGYLARILERTIAVLEGKVPALVYPAATRSRAETGSRAEKKASDLRFKPDPSLPNVLLLGDSISIGYTLPVRELLKGKANVFRPVNSSGAAENCSDTAKGVEMLDRWLALQPKWDVIHFNWGLHDLKHMKKGAAVPTTSADPNDPPLHDVDAYRANLEKIVARLQKTGARLVFATTTPVPEGCKNPFRSPQDPPRYNAAASELMKSRGIAVNDLFALVQPQVAALQLPSNVHFTDKGSKELGVQVAAAIESALKPE